ncbi:MAG: BrxA/BrxB family bacilliredoxin [Acidobacteriota bacterium]
MPYPEYMVAPLREELTRVGVQELRSAEHVDAALKNAIGTTLVVVNSVCGCAAGCARPGIALALQSAVRPDRAYTVFAGQDLEATNQARAYFAPHLPSSPSVALLRDGKIVYMLERQRIEGRTPQAIADDLVRAFQDHCGEGSASTGETSARSPEAPAPNPLRIV